MLVGAGLSYFEVKILLGNDIGRLLAPGLAKSATVSLKAGVTHIPKLHTHGETLT